MACTRSSPVARELRHIGLVPGRAPARLVSAVHSDLGMAHLRLAVHGMIGIIRVVAFDSPGVGVRNVGDDRKLGNAPTRSTRVRPVELTCRHPPLPNGLVKVVVVRGRLSQLW